MSPLERLTELFQKFPGIGPRQAQRFTYHLLAQDRSYIDTLASLIKEVRNGMHECALCFRHYTPDHGETLCDICSTDRDPSQLLIVERDQDILPVERAQIYKGFYFVLGGTIPLLDQHHTSKTRGPALKAIVAKRIEQGLTEVILAFSVNPDGENTARYVEAELGPLATSHNLTISILGRGLSTGSELEYGDAEAVKSAIQNRSRDS